MQGSFDGFARAKSEQLKDVADFLTKEYSFTKEDIKTLMQGSFFGFASATSEKLKEIAESIGDYMESRNIKSKIQQNIQAFLDINVNEINQLVESIKQLMTPLPVNQRQQLEERLKRTFQNHLLNEIADQLKLIQSELISDDECQKALQV